MESALVLCVDDDDAVRNFYEVLFSRYGYEVLTAGSGHQALALLDTHAESIHAAVVDYMLPGMNGFELAAKLKDHDPELPVLMISGQIPELGEMSPFIDAALEKGVPVREIIDSLELLLRTRSSKVYAYS